MPALWGLPWHCSGQWLDRVGKLEGVSLMNRVVAHHVTNQRDQSSQHWWGAVKIA